MTMPRYIAAQQTWQPQRVYETGAVSTAKVFWQVAAGIGIAHSALYVILSIIRLITGTVDETVGSAWLEGGIANTFLLVLLSGIWCAACVVCEWSLSRLGERAEMQAQCWEHYVLSVAASVIAVGLAMQFAGDKQWAMVIPVCTMGIPALCTYFAIKHRRLAQPRYSYPPAGYPLPYGAPVVAQQPVPMPQQQPQISIPQPPQGPYRRG
ncbi:MAG: hypothetical protein ACRCWS_07165 [Propionibacteriaceae bacterium]